MEIITIIGLALTIIALMFSSWQLFSAKKHTDELKEIRESMSTSYIGKYPEFIPELTKLISLAKHEVFIVNSVAVTGLFSNRAAWLDYSNAIEQLLLEGKTVNIIMLNEDKRYEFQKEQFYHTAETWKHWKTEPENENRIKIMLDHHNSTIEPGQLTRDMFINLLNKIHNDIMEQSFVTANIMEIDEHIPINMCIVDNKKAIFATPGTSDGYSENGFITSDARLISSFHEIIIRYQTKYSIKAPNKQLNKDATKNAAPVN